MRQGFVKAAAVTPKIKVADTKYNAELILDMMKESTRQGAKIVVFPELVSDRLYLSGSVFAGTSAAGRKGCADEISKRECFTGRHFFRGTSL